MAKSKLARYKERRNPETKLAIGVGSAFAGYATTRLFSRVAYMLLLKRFPKLAEHVAVGASALGAAGVYFTTKYWPKAREYHEPMTIGAGIALLQAVLQTYLPKFGWVVSDHNAAQYQAKQLPAQEAEAALDLDSLLSDNSDFSDEEVGQPSREEEDDEDLSWGGSF